MKLKHYAAVQQPVVDPLRPGRTVNTTLLRPSGATSFSYVDEHGQQQHLEADAHGWIDFPHHVGEEQKRFRANGAGWFAPGEVASQRDLGRLEGDEMPVEVEPRRGPGRPRKDPLA